MPNDIKGLPPGSGSSHNRPVIQSKTGQAGMTAGTQTTTVVQQEAAKSTSRPDTFKLSDQAQALMKMEQKAAQVPTTNAQKIAHIRAALADGTYTVDAEAVAKKMIDFDSLF